MYRVIKTFRDAETKHVYQKGHNFPYRGQVTKKRVEELSSDENNLKEPLIEPFEVVIEEIEKEITDAFPKHTGGGYYELSNGEKVQGRNKAIEAENELKSGE